MADSDKGQKMKDYEAAIRHRVDCEERAFHIVNKLLDGKVEALYLIECGKMISREHYSDIIEERAISYLCGYPLCDNSLANIPKKKYHISTRTNKVYDISERKNFCSNQCLKASKHFSNQIPDSPVWTRGRAPPDDFKLLPHRNIKGIIGDEVVSISPKRLLEDEVKSLDALDKRTTPSTRMSKESRNFKSKSKPCVMTVNKDDTMNKNSIESSLTSVTSSVKADEDLTKEVPSGAGNIASPLSVNIPQKAECSEPWLNEAVSRLTILEKDTEVGQVARCVDSLKIAERVDSEGFSHRLGLENLSIANSENVTGSKKSGDQKTQCETKGLKECKSKAVKDDSLKECKSKAVQDEQSKKMDQLMKLLSSRKSVLSKMVDIQPALPSLTSKTVSPEQTDSLQPNSALEMVTVDKKVQIQDVASSHQKPSGSDTQPFISSDTASGKEKRLSAKKKTKPSSKFPKPSLTPLEGIKLVLKQWMTEETNEYLSSSSADDLDGPQKFSDPRIQTGYMDLCKRLDVQERKFENIVNDAAEDGKVEEGKGDKLKSPPEYEVLKKEAAEFQLKVTEFITGKHPVAKAQDKKNDDAEREEVRLPTVDAYDQRQIRIKIVLDRLDKCIPDLLTPLCLSLQDVSSSIRELVYTFRLEKDTIVFRPSEWMLVTIFLLKILAEKNANISEAFARESAVRYFSIVLKGIGHTTSDLHVMTQEILQSCSQDKSSDSYD